MVRHAGHRDADAAVLAPGQRDVQVAGDGLGILAVRLVEVADAHQQDDAGMLLAGGKILHHERRVAVIAGRHGGGLWPAVRAWVAWDSCQT